MKSDPMIRFTDCSSDFDGDGGGKMARRCCSSITERKGSNFTWLRGGGLQVRLTLGGRRFADVGDGRCNVVGEGSGRRLEAEGLARWLQIGDALG